MKAGLLFVATALQTFFVLAESFVWKGSSGGSWDEASNWEGNLVPNVAGADVVFNTEGTLSVRVPSMVTVGTVRVAAGTVTLEGTQDFVLSGGAQPGFDVAAGATLTLNLHPAGSSGLVKTGSGTLNMPLDMAGRYTGTTVARGGTFVLKPRTAGSGEVAPGDALLIETGAVFRQEKSDMLPARYRVTVDGGQYVGANNVCDYLGSLTVRNGGSISGFSFLLIDDAETQRVVVDAGTATISCPLAIGSYWGSYGKNTARTLVFDIGEGCSLNMTGAIRSHFSDDPAYVGGIRKTGAGKLILSSVSTYAGETSIEAGDLELAAGAKIAKSVFRMNGGSLTVAEEAVPRIGALVNTAGHTLSIPGRTLEIGGAGDSLNAGVLVAGKIVKRGADTMTFIGEEASVSSLDVNAGRVEIGGCTPLVRYAFDDRDDLGRDTGRLSRPLAVPASVVAGTGVYGSSACFTNRFIGGLTVSSTGFPSGKSSYTICSWVKPKAGWVGVFTLGEKKTNHRYLFTAFDNYKFKCGIWGSAEITLDNPISASTWHHVAVVYDGAADAGTLSVYLDGERAGVRTLEDWQKNSLDLMTENMEFVIGDPAYSDGYYGEVDDVMVFDAALPASSIRNVMFARGESGVLGDGASVRVDASGVLSVMGGTNAFDAISGRGTLHVASRARVVVAPAADETFSIGCVTGGGAVEKKGAGTLTLSRAVTTDARFDVSAGALALRGPAVSLAEHVVAYYTFDGSARGSDSSGNGFTLQSVGKTFAERSADLPGTVYFDGTDGQYLTFDPSVEAAAYDRLPSANESYTVACWINPDAGVAWNGGIFSWGVAEFLSCNAFRFHRDANTGFDGFRVFNWGFDKDYSLADRYAFTAPSAPDGWHHVLITYDGTTSPMTRRFYLDGALQGTEQTNSNSLRVKAENFSVGRCLDNDNRWGSFRGYIDDFIILDCAVSGKQAQALMQGHSAARNRQGTCALASGASVTAVAGETGFAKLSAEGALVAVSGEAVLPENVEISVSETRTDVKDVVLSAGDAFGADVTPGGKVTLPESGTVTYTGASFLDRAVLSAGELTGTVSAWSCEDAVSGEGRHVRIYLKGDQLFLSASPLGMTLVLR